MYMYFKIHQEVETITLFLDKSIPKLVLNGDSCLAIWLHSCICSPKSSICVGSKKQEQEANEPQYAHMNPHIKRDSQGLSDFDTFSLVFVVKIWPELFVENMNLKVS